MKRYIALLGGINVGGHRVKMDVLRGLFEALGFASVETFIASGNVIFESLETDPTALERMIEGRLREALGYKVPTFIRSAEELSAVAGYQPFPEAGSEYHTLSILFMAEALPEEAREALLAFRTPVDDLHLHGREVYWLCRRKTSESLVNWSLLAKTVAMPPATVRNANTIRKLAEKYGRR